MGNLTDNTRFQALSSKVTTIGSRWADFPDSFQIPAIEKKRSPKWREKMAETPESAMDTEQPTEEPYGHERHQRFTLIVVKYVG